MAPKPDAPMPTASTILVPTKAPPIPSSLYGDLLRSPTEIFAPNLIIPPIARSNNSFSVGCARRRLRL